MINYLTREDADLKLNYTEQIKDHDLSSAHWGLVKNLALLFQANKELIRTERYQKYTGYIVLYDHGSWMDVVRRYDHTDILLVNITGYAAYGLNLLTHALYLNCTYS